MNVKISSVLDAILFHAKSVFENFGVYIFCVKVDKFCMLTGVLTPSFVLEPAGTRENNPIQCPNLPNFPVWCNFIRVIFAGW